MHRGLRLLIVSALLGAIPLAWAAPGYFSSSARARGAEAPAAGQRWEYCAVSKAAYAGPPRAGVYWISYFGEAGVQVVEVQASATEGAGAAFAKAITRLGSEGWEMVAAGPLEVNQGQSNALYFKRPKQ